MLHQGVPLLCSESAAGRPGLPLRHCGSERRESDSLSTESLPLRGPLPGWPESRRAAADCGAVDADSDSPPELPRTCRVDIALSDSRPRPGGL